MNDLARKIMKSPLCLSTNRRRIIKEWGSMRAARLLVLAGSLFSASTAAFSQVTISTQPRAVIVTSGQSAAVSVTASAPNALSYQWRRNGYSIPGATSASYTLAAARQGDSDLYDVVVTSGP